MVTDKFLDKHTEHWGIMWEGLFIMNWGSSDSESWNWAGSKLLRWGVLPGSNVNRAEEHRKLRDQLVQTPGMLTNAAHRPSLPQLSYGPWGHPLETGDREGKLPLGSWVRHCRKAALKLHSGVALKMVEKKSSQGAEICAASLIIYFEWMKLLTLLLYISLWTGVNLWPANKRPGRRKNERPRRGRTGIEARAGYVGVKHAVVSFTSHVNTHHRTHKATRYTELISRLISTTLMLVQ